MTRRTRSSSTKTRFLALAPVTLALVLGTTVCYVGIDPAAATTEPTQQVSAESRHFDAVYGSYERFAATHAARERVREARPSPCSGASMHRRTTASVQPDAAASAPSTAHKGRRCGGRYGFFLILLVAWYALGVAVMPWIAPRLARRCNRRC